MGDAEDFWPAIEDIEDPHSPVVLLRRQADILSDKTGFRLRGRVSTVTIRLGREALDALGIEEDPYNADTFTHTFNIEVPVLDDYRYTLFSVSQGIEPYPVVHRNENGQWEALADEAAFIAWLKQTLSSEKTKRVLKTLSEQAAR